MVSNGDDARSSNNDFPAATMDRTASGFIMLESERFNSILRVYTSEGSDHGAAVCALT